MGQADGNSPISARALMVPSPDPFLLRQAFPVSFRPTEPQLVHDCLAADRTLHVNGPSASCSTALQNGVPLEEQVSAVVEVGRSSFDPTQITPLIGPNVEVFRDGHADGNYCANPLLQFARIPRGFVCALHRQHFGSPPSSQSCFREHSIGETADS